MSGKISGQVWDLALPHSQAWVLMAMADHADHDGNNVYPSMPLIAWKTGYSQRQVQRIVRQLEAIGVLVLVSADPGERRHYRIDVGTAARKPERVLPPRPDSTPRHDDVGGRHNVAPDAVTPLTPERHPGDDTRMSGGDDTRMSPKPSSTVSEPPPTARTGALVNDRGGGGGGRVDRSERGGESTPWLHPAWLRMLDTLAVASGPEASRRWWIQADRNRHADSFADCQRVVAWSVKQAREVHGREVQYASQVHDLVTQWRPPEARASA